MSVAQLLLRTVDFGLGGVILLAPLFMGGRHPLGQLVYVALVCLIAVAWAVRQCCVEERQWRASGVELLMLAGFVLILLQIVPLPPGLLQWISPSMGKLLPLWTADTEHGFGAWPCLSLHPEATRRALAIFTAHLLLFCVVVQRASRLEDVERLLRWIALAAIGMACLGIAQFLFGDGKFLWIYQHPFRDTLTAVKGTFSNENHFGHFLALGAGPLIWWLQSLHAQNRPSSTRNRKDAQKQPRSVTSGRSRNVDGPSPIHLALSVGLGIVAVSALLTFSRGAVIVILLAVSTVVIGLAAKKLIGRRSLAMLAAVGVIVGIALCIHGYEPLMTQLRTISSIEELDRNAVRQKLWMADVQAASEFPILGVGSGAHMDVYPTYLQHYSSVVYTHAESGYVQVLMESGFSGITLALLAVFTCGYWCLRSWLGDSSARMSAAAAAVGGGFVASAAHSIWDFVWYIPTTMSIALILAACACRLWRLRQSESGRSLPEGANQRQGRFPTEPHAVGPLAKFVYQLFSFEWLLSPAGTSRLVWGATSVATVIVSLMMLETCLAPAAAAPAWEACRIRHREDQRLNEPGEELASLNARITLLRQALAANPYDSRVNLSLATLLLQRFEKAQLQSENAMGLVPIKDAALSAGFQSAQDQNAWLQRVCGDNFQDLQEAKACAARSIRLCPMQGEAYAFLAELAFLDGANIAKEAAYIEQALAVRPYRGSVLMAAGKHAASGGDFQRGLVYWKRAFHQDPEIQKQIVEMLAPHATAQFFLDEFNPDASGLATLYRKFISLKRHDEAREIAWPYVRGLVQRAKSATERESSVWTTASHVYEYLDEQQLSLSCAKKALAFSPGDYQQRRSLGLKLLAMRRFDEAVEQFEWCRSRRPNDEVIKNKLEQAIKLKLAAKIDDHASTH